MTAQPMSEDAREASDSIPLREARMARGISLEQVTRDIHISKSFLEALEAGDYTDFPGDAYVTGFIRSYASYLELDPEPLVDRYRMQQAASGASAEVPPGRRRSPLVAVLVLALLLFAAGVAALVRWVIPPAAVADRNVGQQADAPATPFVMTGDVVIQVLAIGTVLQVPIGDRRYEVLLARYDNGLVIRYGGNEVLLAVGGERLLDLDGDSRTDLRMLLNSVDRTSEPMRVNLTLQRGTGSDQAAAPVRSGRA